MRDNIFNQKIDLVDFCFDKKVVSVFDDMVRRSVPGYLNTLENIKLISSIYAQKNTNVYDLGCSTGATSLALGDIGNIIAIDNSAPMLEQAQKNLQKVHNIDNIEFIEQDIIDCKIQNASIVVLNLTLQFIDKNQRQDLIDKIYQGLNFGGVLFISEKIHLNNKTENDFINDLHLKFKFANGYSELEIANKRQLLENILITDTPKTHLARFKKSGFNTFYIISKYLNFYSFVAIK